MTTRADSRVHVSALERGLGQLGIDADVRKIECCASFVEMLCRWNRAYNLTGTRDASEIIERHVLDSLSILPYVDGSRLLDLGTGAGFPGVPLAIWHPSRQFHLLDSNAKKMRFLFHVRGTLHLGNVELHNQRAESWQVELGFDCILARAVASIGQVLACSGHLLAPGGFFLMMKGAVDRSELNEVRPPYNVTATWVLDVPGLSRVHQLVRIDRS